MMCSQRLHAVIVRRGNITNAADMIVHAQKMVIPDETS
jgi:hypothetical protein